MYIRHVELWGMQMNQINVGFATIYFLSDAWFK